MSTHIKEEHNGMTGYCFHWKKRRCRSDYKATFFRTNFTITFSKWINVANAGSGLYSFL